MCMGGGSMPKPKPFTPPPREPIMPPKIQADANQLERARTSTEDIRRRRRAQMMAQPQTASGADRMFKSSAPNITESTKTGY